MLKATAIQEAIFLFLLCVLADPERVYAADVSDFVGIWASSEEIERDGHCSNVIEIAPNAYLDLEGGGDGGWCEDVGMWLKNGKLRLAATCVGHHSKFPVNREFEKLSQDRLLERGRGGQPDQTLTRCTKEQVTAFHPGYFNTQWKHNGSTFSLSSSGKGRTLTYVEPRAGMMAEGVDFGTVLFEGSRSGSTYAGTAHIFRKGCNPVPYNVSGTVSADERTITMRGRAPRVTKGCRINGYKDDTLVFDYVPGPRD